MFTSVLVLSFVSLKSVSHAAVTCNSVELESMAYPELVCMTNSVNNGEKVESRAFVCDGQGGTIWNIYENALDCTGTVTRTEDPCFESEPGCTYTAHCGGEVCTYAAWEQWQGVTQCNGDVPAANAYANYTKIGMVIDSTSCVNDEGNSSMQWGCSAQSGVTVSLWMVADCVGDPYFADIPVIAPGCDTTEGSAGTVDCNAVAPGGDSSATNAPTTTVITASTGAPTTSPVTNTPTTSPVTDTPTTSPVTDTPTTSPVTNTPTTSPVTDTPTTSPVTNTPTTSPVTNTPTTSPVTNTPTTAPTVSSPEPTENPTQGPTDATGEPSTAPIEGDDDDDDDVMGSSAYGVKVSSFITLFVVSLYFMAN